MGGEVSQNGMTKKRNVKSKTPNHKLKTLDLFDQGFFVLIEFLPSPAYQDARLRKCLFL